PKKHIIFNQSQVIEHAELAWIFNCVARMGWMQRMTQFKDKAGKNSQNVSLGLFAYPSLMAADILLYKSTHVPVGEDQKQHLELTRDIAQKFNNDFAASIKENAYEADFFPLSEPVITGPATKVLSLRDGTKKMSKSEASSMATIYMLDDADAIAKKIKKAKSDPEPLPGETDGLKDRPEAANLVGIYASLANISQQQVLDQFGGQGFGAFKPALAELAVESLSPIASEMRRYLAEPDIIEEILKDGANRAREIAKNTMHEVRNIVGFIG
ncbi:Tryptophanyl-tRNA synthetase, partial [hydrothermal vent metagenome]